MRRTATPTGEPAAPTGLEATITAFAGRVDLRWKPVKYAVAYQTFLNRTDPTDASAWQLAGISTRTSFRATGLAPASITWFRVSAVGTAGTGPLSEVAHSLAK